LRPGGGQAWLALGRSIARLVGKFREYPGKWRIVADKLLLDQFE
jgi:hypothetical protein